MRRWDSQGPPGVSSGQPGVEQGRRILRTPPVCLLAIMPIWESTRIGPAAIWANCTSDWVRPISAIGTYPDLHLQSYQFSKSFVNRQIGAAKPSLSKTYRARLTPESATRSRPGGPVWRPWAPGWLGWSTRLLGLAFRPHKPPVSVVAKHQDLKVIA